MYLIKVPKLIRNYYSDYTWRFNTDKKAIYLTFDDGPTPEVTDWVLEQLKKYDAQATFFMIGKNVELYPDIAHRVIDANHTIGNHTQTHKNGWDTSTKAYLKDFLQGQKAIAEYTGYKTRIFRPPYGKITSDQAEAILPKNNIVMMDVLSGDFDTSLNGRNCYHNVIRNSKKGSIILFHDSIKAFERLHYALPRVLEYYHAKGFIFSSIPEERVIKGPKKKRRRRKK